MARPAVHATAELLYDSLGDGLIHDDDRFGWQMLYLTHELFAATLGYVDDLVRDSDAGPGWSGSLDPDRAFAEHLPWLAQFVGVRLPPGLTVIEQRVYLRDKPRWRRGSRGAMIAEARATLTGTQSVYFIERASSAYTITVQTLTSETPDPVATLEALLRQKPGGIVLTHVVSDARIIDTLDGSIDSMSTTIDAIA